MKTIIKAILKGIISLFISIVFLSAFCLIYDYVGPFVKNETGATDYKFESYQYIANMAEGFAWLRMDKNGFNNAYEVKKDNVDILLMGSSHIEARQVSVKQNMGYILNTKLPALYTYNIGVSGRDIYLSVNLYANAIAYYKPKYTIIETGKLDLSIDEMNTVINHKVNSSQKHSNSLSYYLKKIPFIKTGFNQLKNWIDLDKINTVKNKEINEDNYREVLTAFLSIISENANDNNITPIIFYHPKEKLNSDGTVQYVIDEEKYKIFEDVCNELNIVFVDTTPYFKELFYKEYKLGHGFTNTRVGSGHLNKYGHKICAQALIDKITELEGDTNVVY